MRVGPWTVESDLELSLMSHEVHRAGSDIDAMAALAWPRDRDVRRG